MPKIIWIQAAKSGFSSLAMESMPPATMLHSLTLKMGQAS